MENVSNVSHSDAQQVLKGIRKSNVNKFVVGQLNINSLKNNSDMLSELIKGFADVFMISEIKLDGRCPEGQFLIDGYHAPFRYDRNGNGGFALCPREQAKVIHCNSPTSETLFVEINLHMKKWLINCSYYRTKIISPVI